MGFRMNMPAIADTLRCAVDDYECDEVSLQELVRRVDSCSQSLAPGDNATGELLRLLAATLKAREGDDEQSRLADADTDELLASVRIVADALDATRDVGAVLANGKAS
jgi:hypothetical protein